MCHDGRADEDRAMPVPMLPPAPLVAAMPAIDFDLRRMVPARPCTAGAADEVVVCAGLPADTRNRLPELAAARFEPPPLRAEIGLFGNVTAGLNVERQDFGRDVSNRVMATIKLPF